MTCFPVFPTAHGAEGKRSERSCSVLTLVLCRCFPCFPPFPLAVVGGRRGRVCPAGNASLAERALGAPTLRGGESGEGGNAGKASSERSSSLGTLPGLRAFPDAGDVGGKAGNREGRRQASSGGSRLLGCWLAGFAPTPDCETRQAGDRGPGRRPGWFVRHHSCPSCQRAGRTLVAEGEGWRGRTLAGGGPSAPPWGRVGEGSRRVAFALSAEGDGRREETLGLPTPLRLPLGTNECHGGARRRQNSTAPGLTTPSAKQPRAGLVPTTTGEGLLQGGCGGFRRKPLPRAARAAGPSWSVPSAWCGVPRLRRGGRSWPTLPCCPPPAVSDSRSDQHAPSVALAPVPGSAVNAPVKKGVLEGPGLRGTTLGGAPKYFSRYRGVEL